MLVDSVEQVEIIERPDVSLQATLDEWWTLERGLYALILLGAVFVRFFALGAQPLSVLEAANAWPAWLAATGALAPAPPTPTSALLYSIHTVLFWITGGGDATARAVPALAGVGLVLLAWWLRPWLGRGTALLVALLFAIDPWLTAMSRLADGAALSLFFGLLALIGLMNLSALPADEPAYDRWRNITAVSAGLLLVSGSLAWSFVPLLVLLWVILQRNHIGLLAWSQPRLRSTQAEAEPPLANRTNGLAQGSRTAFVLFLAAVLLGATGWLAQPEALGLVSSSLTAWLAQLFGSATIAYAPSWPFLRLLLDEPLILLFGLIGLAQLWLQRDDDDTIINHQSWRWFLTAWTLWGLFLVVAPGRNPLSLPMLGVPLLLAAAHAGDRILRQLSWDSAWRERWLLVATLTVLLVSSTFLVWSLVSQSQFDMSVARTVLLFLLLAAMLVVLFALWADWRQARGIAGAYVGCVLLVITLSNLWQLNQRMVANRPEGFWATTTATDVRRLATDIHTLSAQRTGDATQIRLLVQMAGAPDAVLGWYLRPMRNLDWVLAPDVQTAPEGQAPLVLTRAEHTNDAQLAAYRGSRYTTQVHWLPAQLPDNTANLASDAASQGFLARLNAYWGGRWRPLLRWAIYREVKESLPTEMVILWVKSESP